MTLGSESLPPLLVDLSTKADAAFALEWAGNARGKLDVKMMRSTVTEYSTPKTLLEGLVPAEASETTDATDANA